MVILTDMITGASNSKRLLLQARRRTAAPVSDMLMVPARRGYTFCVGASP